MMKTRKDWIIVCKMFVLFLIALISYGCTTTTISHIAYTDQGYSNLAKIHIKRTSRFISKGFRLTITDNGVVVSPDGKIVTDFLTKSAATDDYTRTIKEMDLRLGTTVGELGVKDELHYDRLPGELQLWIEDSISNARKTNRIFRTDKFTIVPGHAYFFEIDLPKDTGWMEWGLVGYQTNLIKTENLGDQLAAKELAGCVSPEEFLKRINAYRIGSTYKPCLEEIMNLMCSLSKFKETVTTFKSGSSVQELEVALKDETTTVYLKFQDEVLERIDVR